MLARGGIPKAHKYRAVRTDCGHGHSHPSKLEAKRCAELHLLQRAGEITNLTFEPAFPVFVRDTKVFVYKADFSYFDKAGDRVIEDVKGFLTPVYKLKKKMVEAQYHGTRIVEVTR